MGLLILRYLSKAVVAIALPITVGIDLMTILVMWLSGEEYIWHMRLTDTWIDIIEGI